MSHYKNYPPTKLAVIANINEERAQGIVMLFEALKNLDANPDAISFLLTIANGMRQFPGTFHFDGEQYRYE